VDQIEPLLRSIILQRLQVKRSVSDPPLSVEHLLSEVAAHAKQHQLKVGRGYDAWILDRYGRAAPSPHLVAHVWDLAWDLIIEGILRPGSGSETSTQFPVIHLTEFGATAIADSTTPYDPDGYVKALHDAVPTLDPVIADYISESARTLRAHCLLSSTITLGCACEKAFLLLLDAYTNALNTTDRPNFEADLAKKWQIKKKHEVFTEWYNKHLEQRLRGKLNSDRITEFEFAMTTVFTYFRNVRNDAGHPTGKTFSRETVLSHLVVFPAYLRVIYDVIAWLGANTPL
jgi:hypothetical protein